MDFMYDQLSGGRSYRLFSVVDDFNREALAIDIDLSLPAERVVRALDRVIEWRGKPLTIRSDNGSEYIGCALTNWAERQGFDLNTFSRASHSRTLTSNATTGQCAATG